MNKSFTAKIINLAVFIGLLLLLNQYTVFAETVELKVAYQESAPKYYRADSGGKQSVEGICMDIIRAITEYDSGLKFVPFKDDGFLPFARIKQYLGDGKIDAFVGMTKTAKREKVFVYSKVPLYPINWGFAARNDDDAEINSIDDIRRLGSSGTILSMTGGSITAYLKQQAGGKLLIEETTSVLQNLKKLMRKRGRFVAYHDLGLHALIRQNKLEGQVRVLPVKIRTMHQYVAFSKNVPAGVVEKIDTILKTLAENGTLADIYSKYVPANLSRDNSDKIR